MHGYDLIQNVHHYNIRTEGFINSDAKKKTPTIIAGFNKKRCNNYE